VLRAAQRSRAQVLGSARLAAGFRVAEPVAMKLTTVTFASLGLALVACGGGGGDPGTITADVGAASAENAVDVAAAVSSLDGTEAAGAVGAMIALNQGILLPGDPSPRVAGSPTGDAPAAVAPVLHGSATCGDSGCVFDHFGDDRTDYAWEINGTITRSGDRYDFAIDYDITVDTTHLHWRMDGALTVTPAQIDGSITVVADGDTGGSSVHWEVTVDYVAIGLDASGCAISGRIDAHSTFESGGRVVFDLEGVLTFGPACGEVH
jgi:hypothetical protein